MFSPHNPTGRDGHDIIAAKGLKKTKSNCVEWDKEHAEYPRNWSRTRKAYDTSVIVFFEFYTTIISTTGPSAAIPASKEYGLSRVAALVVFTLSYNLGQALGGLIMPPFSESFGRKKPYIYSCAVYSASSLIVGVVPSVIGVVIGRLLSGFASAVPSVVVAGSIEDLYDSRQRVWLILLWNNFATLGLVLGPIYGSFIAEAIGWRWIHYTSAIITILILVFLILIRESRPTTLLSQKLGALKKTSNIDNLRTRDNPDKVTDARSFCRIVLWRPTRLGLTEPIVAVVSIMEAMECALIYLFTESLTVVYTQYGWSETTTSLVFIAIGLGIPLSILPRYWDLRAIDRRKHQNKNPQPEEKITGFAIAAPALAAGLWLFSWTVPPLVQVHWLVSMIGLALIGFAANEFAYTLSAYLADSYTIYASSALASMAFLRSIVSGIVPLFAYQMFSGLGSNVAGSIVAAIATVFCITPFIFIRYGRKLRERSQFAQYSLEINRQYGGD